MTRRLVSYLRVSSDDQRERQTIETQQDVIDQFLARCPDLELVGSYRDDGVSGSIPLAQRPAGRQLVAAAAAGFFDAIVVTRADRLGRDAIDLMQTRALFESLGIELIGVQEPMDDEMSFDMRAVWAKHEKKRFQARSSEGTSRAAREGRFCGGICPIGYKVEGKKQNARLVPSDDVIRTGWTESELVRHIFERIGVEGWSTRRVAAELNAFGVPTAYQRDATTGVRRKKTQGIWRAGRIGNLVRNPVYKGAYHYGRRTTQTRDVIVAEVPALVSPELWQATQETMQRNRVQPTTARRTYLLRGVVRCGLCGLTYSGSQGRPHHWYRCNGQLVERGPIQGRCPARSVRVCEIDDIVWRDILTWLRDPGDVLDELGAEVAEGDPDGQPTVNAATLRSRLTELAAERQNAIGLAVRGLLGDADLAPELARIAAQNTEIERRLADLDAVRKDKAPTIPEDLLAQLRARIEELSMEQRQDVVRALVERVTVHTTLDGGGKKELRIVIEYRFPEPPASDGVVLTDPGRDSWRR